MAREGTRIVQFPLDLEKTQPVCCTIHGNPWMSTQCLHHHLSWPPCWLLPSLWSRLREMCGIPAEREVRHKLIQKIPTARPLDPKALVSWTLRWLPAPNWQTWLGRVPRAEDLFRSILKHSFLAKRLPEENWRSKTLYSCRLYVFIIYILHVKIK